ncbi:unnamed protein product [Diamesa serratosioi]
METKLENLLDTIASNDKVTGVLLTDNQGLCYGTRGEAVDKASGIIAAIVDQASKIHPNSNAPVVVLETSDREVTISKYGFLTGAIYKSKPSKK